MYIPEEWGSRLASPNFRPGGANARRRNIAESQVELAKIEANTYKKQEFAWKAWKLRWN